MAALFLSVMLLVVVLELVRRRKLVEEYALLWIALGLVMTALSVGPGMWERAARWLRVPALPIVDVVMSAVAIGGVALWISVIMSRQRQRIERLTEETAILSAELRELRSSRKP
jgi:Uncharacterized conserved protein (DUF2304)